MLNIIECPEQVVRILIMQGAAKGNDVDTSLTMERCTFPGHDFVELLPGAGLQDVLQ
jgi:hypothetical protein